MAADNPRPDSFLIEYSFIPRFHQPAFPFRISSWRESIRSQVSWAEYELAKRLYNEHAPSSWPSLPIQSYDLLAHLRLRVHRRFSLRDEDFQAEIVEFYREVGILVSQLSEQRGNDTSGAESEVVRLRERDERIWEDDSDSGSDDGYYGSRDEVSDAISEISAAIYHEYYAENYGDVELSTESDDESDASVSPDFDTPQPPVAKRKEVEGDCPICMGPLKVDCLPKQIDSTCEPVQEIPLLSGSHGVGSDCNAQNQNLGDKEQDDCKDDEKENEDDDGGGGGDGDGDELIWCQSTCGINFHYQCFKEWAYRFERRAQVTCPHCCRRWMDWSRSPSHGVFRMTSAEVRRLTLSL